MKILSAYLYKEFVKLVLICQMMFLSIYVMIDFLQKIDNFVEAGVSKSVIFSYFYYRTPYSFVQMIPAATLISGIMMFCIMKKNHEIIALKACGMNMFRLLQPVIIASLFAGIVLFLLSEVIVPYTSSKSNEIWMVEVAKQDPTRFYGSNQIWYRGSGSIYFMRRFDNKQQVMDSPSFYFFDSAFRLTKRIDGRRGVWENGKWKIEEGIIQEAKGDGTYHLARFDKLRLDIPETPETFVRGVKSPEEMGYWQLKRYAERVRQEGYDDTRYLVDMNIKIAFPFVCVILIVIGAPITLRLKKGGAPLALSIGMGVCFIYLFVLGFSRSLGLSGVLPPVLSAWLTNLVFIFAGIYLMMRLEK